MLFGHIGGHQPLFLVFISALIAFTIPSQTNFCDGFPSTGFNTHDIAKIYRRTIKPRSMLERQNLPLLSLNGFGGVEGLRCSFGFSSSGPTTVCEYTFVGTLYSTSVNVSQVVPGAYGTFNASFNFYGNGIFDVTEDLLNLSLSYSGELSGDISCPEGCNMPNELSGVVKVSEFHKLLTTPNGNARIPEHPGISIFAELEIPWKARLHAFTNFSTSFKQFYSFNNTAPGDPIKTSVSPLEASIHIFPSYFRQPFAIGEFYASPVIRIVYKHTSFTISSLVAVDAGLRFSLQSRRRRYVRRMRFPCSIVRASLTPEFRNATLFLEASQDVGWPTQDVTEEYLPAGRTARTRQLICSR